MLHSAAARHGFTGTGRAVPALFAVLAAVLAGACNEQGGLSVPAPEVLEVPAAPGSAQPFVAPHGERVIVSWTEAVEGGHALRYAEWDGAAWTTPRSVARGDAWFVNWADFPSVVALDDNRFVAHWLQRSGPGRYAYDVVITTSDDGGATWAQPVRPHGDGTETEHGFVSLFPHAGAAAAVWLDGRRFADTADGPATNEMQLRFTTVEHATARFADGSGAATATAATITGPEALLDDRICDCCQTAVAVTDAGPVVFYRDRLPGEIRDISVTRLEGGRWTAPRPVHEDGWEINACPVNGPAADAAGNDVVVAWYTGAAGVPRVRLAFSGDAGATFDPVVTVDDGQPIGRADVLLLRSGAALVVWLERVGEDAEIRGRIVARDGTRGPAAVLAATTAGRAGGFPRMARRGQDVVLAWTEPGEASRVRAAVLRF